MRRANLTNQLVEIRKRKQINTPEIDRTPIVWFMPPNDYGIDAKHFKLV